MTTTSIPRAAIYCRVSTDKQEQDGTSLDSQESACKAYCDQHGLTVADVYRETFSGYTRERPQLRKLREQVRSGAVDTVVVYATDRLARNQSDIGVLVDDIYTHHATLDCVTEPFENTAVGKFILGARTFAAEVEREKIKERTMRGKRTRVESGKVHGHGSELYGFRRDKVAGVRCVSSRLTVHR